MERITVKPPHPGTLPRSCTYVMQTGPATIPTMTTTNEETPGVSQAVITVLKIAPVQAGKLLALADVEIVLDDVPLIIHGVQVRADSHGTEVTLPRYRAPNGEWRTAITLPEEVKDTMGDMVIAAAMDIGHLVPVGI